MTLPGLWGDVVSGTVSGLVSGVLLVATLFGINWLRNRLLERRLRNGFARCGVGYGDGFFHMVIENQLPISVRVRAVVLVGRKGEGYLDLRYMRPVAQAALFNALGLASSPSRISVAAHFPAESGGEAGVVLAGLSGGLWGAPRDALLRQSWNIEDGWMVVEYPTLFGGSAFIRSHFDAPTLGLVRGNIAELTS